MSDLISRQDALNALYGSLNLDTGIAKIESLPSADRPNWEECEYRVMWKERVDDA